jgi:hypothetical protein
MAECPEFRKWQLWSDLPSSGLTHTENESDHEPQSRIQPNGISGPARQGSQHFRILGLAIAERLDHGVDETPNECVPDGQGTERDDEIAVDGHFRILGAGQNEKLPAPPTYRAPAVSASGSYSGRISSVSPFSRARVTFGRLKRRIRLVGRSFSIRRLASVSGLEFTGLNSPGTNTVRETSRPRMDSVPVAGK